MCGIVGYIGEKQAAPLLLEGLEKLEYRGYDSAGIAVEDNSGNIEIMRAKGRLSCLAEKTRGGKALEGCCGIGHTRWATHGEPSECNAHPHFNDGQTIAAVHNGIIENYTELKKKLLKRGYSFYSETDTEVATKLVDYYYEKHGDPVKAIANFTLRVKGSYALAVLFKDYPKQIFAVRKDSPMIIGVTKKEALLASDVPAILKYTKNVYFVENSEIICLEAGKAVFYNLDKEELEKTPVKINWNAESAEKGGYEHFMLKEMHEQPKVVKDTVSYYTDGEKINLNRSGLTGRTIKKIKNITIVACGSAYHAGVVAQYVIEKLARIPVRVELASEFRYREPVADKNCLVIAISQSGETADTLAAVREAKKLGMKTLAIVNVVGSSLARVADGVMYTYAGPEIAVATTKAYSAQLIAEYLLALKFAKVRGTVSAEKYSALLSELNALSGKIESILNNKAEIQRFAAEAANKKTMFFIGRGVDYAACIEGSLKLKEISYIHSEAYAAGELKHGTISLIEDGTLVLGVLMQQELLEKTLSNLVETKSRGAYVAALTYEGMNKAKEIADVQLVVPQTYDVFAASLAVIPLQLFAYYLSVLKGNDVDKPRNLAKSVTVE